MGFPPPYPALSVAARQNCCSCRHTCIIYQLEGQYHGIPTLSVAAHLNCCSCRHTCIIYQLEGQYHGIPTSLSSPICSSLSKLL